MENMDLFQYVRARNWPVVAGYLFFIGMMAVGYLYNVTFVQLGLVDLGLREEIQMTWPGVPSLSPK